MPVGTRLLLDTPLEAEDVAIGIGEIQLLHAVRRDFWLLCGYPHFPQVGVGYIYVGTSEIDCSVLVSCNTHGIRNRRALALVVRCVLPVLRTLMSAQSTVH